MQDGIRQRQARTQQQAIDLRHNRLGNIGPFQQEKLRKRSRMLLGGAAVFLVIAAVGIGVGLFFPEALGPGGGGGLPHQNHAPAKEALIFGGVAAVLFMLSAGAWWHLEADIDRGTVEVVEGKATMPRPTEGDSKPRHCTIGFARFSVSMLEDTSRLHGRHVRAYYTPGTRLLLAIEPRDD